MFSKTFARSTSTKFGLRKPKTCTTKENSKSFIFGFQEKYHIAFATLSVLRCESIL